MALGGKTLTVYLAADLKNFNNNIGKAQTGLRGLGDSLSRNLGTAAIGAAAAVGALAVAIGTESVKAAIEDEAAMDKLATTLQNVGLAHDTQKVEDYISSLERSLGIADDQLRPAYDRLVRSIGNTEEANRTLALALDISAGSGKSLDSVVQALGKAYDGNTAGLSRLGAGIDAAILRTGDMNRITQYLAETFQGQAQTAANTYQGQIERVSLGIDNLKEALGRGLLKALGDSSGATQGLVDVMADLEPILEDAGTNIGDFTRGIGVAISRLNNLTVETDAAGESTGNFFSKLWTALQWNPILKQYVLAGQALTGLGRANREAADATKLAQDAAGNAIPSWRDYDHTIRLTTDAFREYLRLNAVRMSIVKEENKDYKDLASRQREVNTYSSIAIDLTDKLTTSRGGASSAASAQARAEGKLTQAFQDQQAILTSVSGQLQQATRDLEAARKAAEDYAAGIAAQITSGINLGTAFEGQFDEAGQRTGASLLDGFNKQIEQAQYFGNVLTAIKAQGADQSLIEQIASLGPVTGAALGQQMLDEGLVKTLSDKWVEVQDQTKTLAMGLVPEFMTAGIASGEAMVTSLAEQVKNETKILTRLGRQIAKPVGAGFKAQFLKDIADAVAEVEAIQTAARAEKVAAATARGQILTEQAVAQALGQIIGRSDARLGVTNQPVLA